MRAGFSEGGRAAAMVDGDVDAAAGEAGELFPELRKLRGAQSRATVTSRRVPRPARSASSTMFWAT